MITFCPVSLGYQSSVQA